MNLRARQLGLKNTHYENPIGLDDAGQLLLGARPRDARHRPAHEPRSSSRSSTSPSVTLKSGDHPRTFANRNTLVRRYAYVNGVKTGHTTGAGYVLVGSASRHGIQLISAVLDEPSEAARDVDTMRAVRLRLQALPAHPRRGQGPRVRHGADPASAPGASSSLVAGRTRAPDRPARAPRATSGSRVHAPDSVAGPIRARPAPRARRGAPERPARRHRPAGRRAARVPAAGHRPAHEDLGGPPARARRCSRSPSWAVRCCWHAAGGRSSAGARRGRPAPHDRHRHAQHGHRQDAVGAELPARPPPPHRRADDDAGRQGRQRRARAQGARARR